MSQNHRRAGGIYAGLRRGATVQYIGRSRLPGPGRGTTRKKCERCSTQHLRGSAFCAAHDPYLNN